MCGGGEQPGRTLPEAFVNSAKTLYPSFCDPADRPRLRTMVALYKFWGFPLNDVLSISAFTYS
jgi:hypothetical protein